MLDYHVAECIVTLRFVRVEKNSKLASEVSTKDRKRIKIKNSSEKQGDDWETKVLEATADSVSFQSGCQFGRKTQKKGLATRQMTMARLRR